VQARIETEDHAMSLIRNRRGFLGALFSALLALALFDPGAATAQQVKQIKLTEKHIQGFMAAYDDIEIMPGIDPQTKKFTEPAEQIKNEIAALKADKSVPEAEKKEGLAQLEAALKIAKPIQFKENIALVLKYFDKLPLKQEEGPAD